MIYLVNMDNINLITVYRVIHMIMRWYFSYRYVSLPLRNIPFNGAFKFNGEKKTVNKKTKANAVVPDVTYTIGMQPN